MKFQIVDAFTRQTFGGNPAGVVLLPEGADFPADETMRKTAAELQVSKQNLAYKMKKYDIR
jgi:predicted PhzF superfamily epimerase YddE/YHI9